MNELIKIRDLSLKYGVSARTLRYYEDLGLLRSVRGEDYSYRLYDNSEIKRLEQILALRKLNISIKDIKTIFTSNDISVLLDILSKKVTDIDEDTASLHELKKIVLEFIERIKQSKSMDTKELYECVVKLEHSMNETDLDKAFDNETSEHDTSEHGALDHGALDHEASVNNADVSQTSPHVDPLSRLYDLNVRLISLPACQMVSSGLGTFGEDANITQFDQWFMEASKKNTNQWQIPLDFMWFDAEHGATVWWYVKFAEDLDTGGFEVVDYEGGLYAAAVSRDGDDEDGNRVYHGIKKWIENSDQLELDERSGHSTMFHIITSEAEKELLGYHQLEIFVPVKRKESKSKVLN